MASDEAAKGKEPSSYKLYIGPALVILAVVLAFAYALKPSRTAPRIQVLTPQGDGLWLKSEPSPGGANMTRLPDGSLLETLDRRGDWLKVKTREGAEGWIEGYEEGSPNFDEYAPNKVSAPQSKPDMHLNPNRTE